MEYILNWTEFKFYEGVKEALSIFADIFGTIVMITNQRGIGKGLMTEADLLNIHEKMLAEINLTSGRIDKIYYCTSLSDDCIDRKPNAGMAHQAKKDFANINFDKSVMIGNKLSDMQFGKSVGMHTIYLATTNPEIELPHPLIDYRYNDLHSVGLNLMGLRKS